jgi:hypothetical protein
MKGRLGQTLLWLAAAGLVALCTASVFASQQQVAPQQLEFFEQRVRPLLVEHCYECHAGKKRNGGLSLETRAGWQMGGDRGPAIVPGRPDESLLIQAVGYQDDDLQMPPDGRLPQGEISVLEAWVRMGAPDPRHDPVPDSQTMPNPCAGPDHWSFQPLFDVDPPHVNDSSWPVDGVDSFILARLEQHGWRPSPDADRYTWLRRVSLDLTGLPPTPTEMDAFVADTTDQAFERVVDRLLATPAFGERWARPWLDLVGYADQIGSANNVPAEHAWRYRDYVIRAFNTDRPFDQFVREQLAGDLLPARTVEERQDQITATGFLVLGNVNIVEADKLVMRMDLVDLQIEKFGKAFLGMTLNCVRCHDHKFDPITLQDYYGLAGIFANTESTYKAERGVWSSVTKVALPESLDQITARETALRAHLRKIAAAEQEQAEVEARLAQLDPLIEAAKRPAAPENGAGPAALADRSAAVASLAEWEKERSDLTRKQSSIRQRLWHLEYLRPAPPEALAVKDTTQIGDARIQVRGNPHVLGEAVPRGFIRVVSRGVVPAIPADESGRRQLADWLIGPAHHLVARVAVNRFWQKLFGHGVVASVDYFGVRGEAPTHPELLDDLARQFIADGWSQKRLLRRLVLSRTYRQRSGAERSSGTLATDPDNRLLWRMSPRRLEAEMIRDAALAASGQLLACQGGPALAPEFMQNVGGLDPKDVNPISFSLKRFRDDQPSLRTIYLPVVRSSEQGGPADTLNFFDFPQPAQSTGQRPTTAVASQTLFLLNGPLLKEAACRLAADLLSDGTTNDDDVRLAALYQRVLNRPFSPDEESAAKAFLAAATIADSADRTVSAGARTARTSAWQQLAHALLASNEFLFRL